MPTAIPQRMRAIVVAEHHESASDAVASLRVVERTVPDLAAGQVLVRIEAAPCNPSDVLYLQGKYGVRKTLPAVPGWEGAGTVVAHGGGWWPGWLVGKRVACAIQGDRDGTWAEYCVADAGNCIPLKNALAIEQAASMIINPWTAIGLLVVARRHGHRAGIQTAGASQLGRMLLRIAADEGFPLVSVVRRADQAEMLRKLGADLVLNSADADFAEQLKRACTERKITVGFDAIAGDMPGRLLAAMPPHSTILVYGALSEAPCEAIAPVDLIFHDKTVAGFFLGDWLRQCNIWKLLRMSGRVQRLLISGRIATQIQRRLALDEVSHGLGQYLKKMTAGKMLIVPHGERID